MVLITVTTLQIGSIPAYITVALQLEKSIIFAMNMQRGLLVLCIHVLGDDYVKYMGVLMVPKSMPEEIGIVQ